MLPRGRALQSLGLAIRHPFRARARRGIPLPEELRRQAEALFGEDLSDVRIIVGPEPRRMGARAFTSGSLIYVSPEEYSPSSAEGQRLLGHELAHVVQQRRGRVRNPHGYGVAVVNDLALESEADQAGRMLQELLQRQAPRVTGHLDFNSVAGQALQRMDTAPGRQLLTIEAPRLDKMIDTPRKSYVTFDCHLSKDQFSEIFFVINYISPDNFGNFEILDNYYKTIIGNGNYTESITPPNHDAVHLGWNQLYNVNSPESTDNTEPFMYRHRHLEITGFNSSNVKALYKWLAFLRSNDSAIVVRRAL